MGLKLSELGQMNQAERDAALSGLVQAAKAAPNGQLKRLASGIQEFEQRYEMTSSEMLDACRLGTQKDTADTAKWQILLTVRDRVQARAK